MARSDSCQQTTEFPGRKPGTPFGSPVPAVPGRFRVVFFARRCDAFDSALFGRLAQGWGRGVGASGQRSVRQRLEHTGVRRCEAPPSWIPSSTNQLFGVHDAIQGSNQFSSLSRSQSRDIGFTSQLETESMNSFNSGIDWIITGHLLSSNRIRYPNNCS